MLANHPSPLSKAVTGETRGDLRSYMHSTTVAALSTPTNEVTELSSCLAGQASESTLIVANASVLCSARWRKRRTQNYALLILRAITALRPAPKTPKA